MERQLTEVRLAGRGGQGVVTCGELLGRAVLGENRRAQSIPTFGPERRGALAMCTLRVSDSDILLKFSAANPHLLLVFDPTIWHVANVTAGLDEGGTLLFNSPRAPEEIEADLRAGRFGYQLGVSAAHVLSIDATGVALEFLGRPIPNTTMMGALAAATGLVRMQSIERVIRERFGDKAEANIRAAHAGRDRLRRRGD